MRTALGARPPTILAWTAVVVAGCNVLLGYEAGQQGTLPGGGSGGGTATAVGAGGTGGTTPAGQGDGAEAAGGSGASGGHGGSEDLGPEVPCTDSPVDDFDDNSLDATLWTVGGGTGVSITEESQEIFVSLQASAPDYGRIDSASSFALRDCAVWLEAKELLNSQVQAEAFLEARADDQNRARIEAAPGNRISFELVVAGLSTGEAGATYDAVEHRWWRIRERAGTIHFDTSPNGTSWTERTAHPTPTYAGAVQMRFGAGYFGSVTSPGRARFDNANVTP
ncbi:MAG: hypothetical protein JRI23_21280 [Deltaproteobacteria bacterium]|jgi:hypothetical protein|nr:hypothetical protein [Deltaproteobacteria bacterium]MBW2534476.1 hypothetical protein [Deltaproteobacteria bacterium]